MPETVEFGLGAVTDPASSSGHTVRVRGLINQAVGGAMTLTTELRQGASALSTPATWDDTLTVTAQTFSHTLSGAQTDAITDYSTLRLRFTATQADPPAPTLVGAGTAQFTATNAATFAPGLPAGFAADDIHILVAHRSDNTAMTSLAGWTQLAALSGNNTVAQRVEVWWRRAVGGDSAPTVTFGSGTVVRGGQIFGIRGCRVSSDPFDTGGGAPTRSSNAIADLTVEFTDLTTQGTNRFLLAVGAFEDDPTTATTMTNWTQPGGAVSGSALGNDMAIFYQHRTLSAAGSSGTSAVTVSGGTIGVSPSVGIVIALIGENNSRARVTWAELEVPAAAEAGAERNVDGNQPTATGTLARLYQALRSLAGAQPNATGTLGRILQAARALGGSQPAATGTLARVHQRTRTLDGSQPAATGTLTAQISVFRSLSGNQPAATGTLTAQKITARTVAGNQPTATGTLARRLQALRSLTGNQPAATGTLTRVLVALRTLAGNQPTATGTLLRSTLRSRTLSGAQPAPSGTLTGQKITGRAVAGSQPAATGTLVRGAKGSFISLAGAQPAPSGTLTRIAHTSHSVSGAQPAPSGTLARQADVSQAFAGNQPAPSGALTRTLSTTRALAGNQPSATGSVVYVFGVPIPPLRVPIGATLARTGRHTATLVRSGRSTAEVP